MKRINNKSINLSLRIMTIFAFVLIFIPINRVSAYGAYITGCGDGGCNEAWGAVITPAYQAPVTYLPPYQAPVYANPAPTNVVYTGTYHPAKKTVKTSTSKCASTITSSFNTTTTTNNYDPSTNPSSDSNNNKTSGVAASAVLGSNSLLPSGLIQWILLAILILIIVILARRIFGAKEKYLATPLKHE